MSIPQLKQLLEQGFYKHGLDARAADCFSEARTGQFSPEFFILGSILTSLGHDFDEIDIERSEVTRVTGKYREVITQVLDGIETRLPVEQRYRRLEDLLRAHLSEDD